MAKIEVLNPVALTKVEKPSALAKRPASLDNKRIALYWNGKPNGDVTLNLIAELLGKRFKGIKAELIRCRSRGTAKQVEYAKTFDAVIGATGD